MGLRKLTEKSGQMSDIGRLVEQLAQCFCRLAVVNEDIRKQRSRGDLSGQGALMAEQRELLQRTQGLRNIDLPEALLREERAERERLPGQIEDLQRQINGARAQLLEEIQSTAEHFFVKLLLVGGQVGNEGASLVLPIEIQDCLSRSRAAAEEADIRKFERDLASKRITMNTGLGMQIQGKAGSLAVNAMTRAREEHGFDIERDFFDPLYRDKT